MKEYRLFTVFATSTILLLALGFAMKDKEVKSRFDGKVSSDLFGEILAIQEEKVQDGSLIMNILSQRLQKDQDFILLNSIFKEARSDFDGLLETSNSTLLELEENGITKKTRNGISVINKTLIELNEKYRAKFLENGLGHDQVKLSKYTLSRPAEFRSALELGFCLKLLSIQLNTELTDYSGLIYNALDRRIRSREAVCIEAQNINTAENPTIQLVLRKSQYSGNYVEFHIEDAEKLSDKRFDISSVQNENIFIQAQYMDLLSGKINRLDTAISKKMLLEKH